MYIYVHILFCVVTVLKFSKTYDNLALNRQAEQSSTKAVQAGPNLVVDNNTDQRFASCASTEQTSVVWWRVDLGEVKSIHDIRVFYRNDSDNYIQLRLKYHAGFSLYISNTKCSNSPNEGYLCYQNNGTVFHLESDHVCTRHGRYVTYYNWRQKDLTYAELCEVQVFGCASAGVYGENCEKKCPINCRNNQCDIVTGACLQCIDGWGGQHCDQNLTVEVFVPMPLTSTPSSSQLQIYRALVGGLFLALVVFVGVTIALSYIARKLHVKTKQTKNGHTTHITTEQDNGYATLGVELNHQYSQLGISTTENVSGEHRYLQIRANRRQPQESSDARGSQTSVKSIEDTEPSDHHYSQLGVNRTKSQESNNSNNYVHIL
ncbi:uncharacterized protein LOC133174188 [Saccostrea echinata]|uniref:uncharacterized protein LOC133174188 n=1 Tax=Saccostrea echinata TaxID=191078 RepID=UPI002A80EF75|nr:uncharacterized protein LOC133174188 [Saccostrea echinata]